MKQHLKSLFFIFMLGFLTFSNGLSNPFLIDDHAFFEEKLKNIKYLPLHFLPDKNRALRIEGESADPLYRPLATIVPMISYLTFKNNVTGHHVTNLVLFCLAGWGIYLFLMYLGAPYLWSFLAAVLYVIHPINGVAVNYITASCFSVQVLLMLAALYFLCQRKIIIPCVLYLLSTWCHETAMFLPAYAFILLAVFSDKKDMTIRVKEAWNKVWPLFAVLGVLFIFRMFYASLDESILKKISQYHMTFPQYAATWTMLVAWYLSKLFWFQNIVLIMAHQPLTEGVGFWLFILVLLVALAGYLIWIVRREKIMLLGLLWFIFGLFPSVLACFFQPIHGMMIEPHWFLFPVIGFFIFVAGIIVKLMEHKKVLAHAALIVIVFFSVYFSRWHNYVWGDEVRYCTFWLKQSPSFVAVNAYIAKAYEYRKEYDLARHHYNVILDRGYKSYIAYTNMALMDMQEGKWESAKNNLLKVLEIDPKASVAVNNMGVIYFNEGDYKTALEYFIRARDLDRFTILRYVDISKTYLKLGDQQKAIEALEQALDIVPGEEHAAVDLIQIYIENKDKENVIKLARLLLKHSQNPYSLKNAGILLQGYGLNDEARKASIKAQRIFNSNKQ